MSRVSSILAAVARGASFSSDIARRTGIDRSIVQVRLAELKRRGYLLAYQMRPNGRPGRPEKLYRLRMHA